MYPTPTTEIWSAEIRKSKENAPDWYVINQDTWYDMSRWTTKEAEADYQSPESAMKRAEDEWSAWVD